MKEVCSIPLQGQVQGGDDLEFLEAEVSTKYDIPFVVVRYSVSGQKQKTGLRLDLDKQVFIDHVEGNGEKQRTLDRAAREIVKVLGSAFRPSPGNVYTRTQ